jgi:PqqD family protein of HPr-rel-A system
MKVWCAASEHFRLRTWDGEMVVFDERSADTHALDPLATSLVTRLKKNGPAGLAELCDAVAPYLEDDEKQDPQTVVADALAFLETLRLVEGTERE